MSENKFKFHSPLKLETGQSVRVIKVGSEQNPATTEDIKEIQRKISAGENIPDVQSIIIQK